MGLVLGTITFLIHVNNSQGKLKMGQYIKGSMINTMKNKLKYTLTHKKNCP